jgi:hypothetical protein
VTGPSPRLVRKYPPFWATRSPLGVGPLVRQIRLICAASVAVDSQDASRPLSELRGQHEHEAIFSPGEVVASLTANGRVVAPDAVILTYQQFLLDELRARGVQPSTGYPAPWRSLWFTGSGARTRQYRQRPRRHGQPEHGQALQRYWNQAQEHTARAQRADLWPEDWSLHALWPLGAGRTLEVKKEMRRESNREPN